MSLPMKLWEIGDEIDRITLDILEAEGEVTDEIAEKLDRMEGLRSEKMERVALMRQTLKRSEEVLTAEIKRMTALRNQRRAAWRGLDWYLQREMSRAGMPVLEGDLIKVRVQKNSRPSVTWLLDPYAIPDDFRREVPPAYDADVVLEFWKKHGEAPEGFAVEQGYHLRMT